MDLAFVAPKGRVSHETDFRLCIICQTISDDDLNNLTKRGIDSFVNALQLRHDDVYDRPQHSIQDIDAFLERAPKCHRSCRSRYTHKRDLEMLETKRVKRNNDPEIQNTNTSVKPNRSSPVCLKSHCFICKTERDSKGEMQLILVATVLTAVSENIKSMANLSQQESTHHGETHKQATEEHMHVEEIKKVICQQMINPFQCNNQVDLLNIATGEKAASKDLVHAQAKGMEAIMKAEQVGSSKIEPLKLVTFSSQKKTKPSRKQSLIRIYQDETAGTRVLCFYRDADPVTRQIAFSHEWTDYPSSLFEVDPRLAQGFVMRKGNKSDFLAVLIAEAEQDVVLQLPSLPQSDLSTVYLVDTMAFVNKYQKMGAKTFGELPQLYLRKLLQLKPEICNCVNIIGDRYDFDDSHTLKGDERQRRNQTDQARQFSPSKSLEIPDWNLLMKNPRNKGNLQNFIGTSLCESPEAIPDGVTIILGGMMENKGHTLSITSASSSVLGLTL